MKLLSLTLSEMKLNLRKLLTLTLPEMWLRCWQFLPKVGWVEGDTPRKGHWLSHWRSSLSRFYAFDLVVKTNLNNWWPNSVLVRSSPWPWTPLRGTCSIFGISSSTFQLEIIRYFPSTAYTWHEFTFGIVLMIFKGQWWEPRITWHEFTVGMFLTILKRQWNLE